MQIILLILGILCFYKFDAMLGIILLVSAVILSFYSIIKKIIEIMRLKAKEKEEKVKEEEENKKNKKHKKRRNMETKN